MALNSLLRQRPGQRAPTGTSTRPQGVVRSTSQEPYGQCFDNVTFACNNLSELAQKTMTWAPTVDAWSAKKPKFFLRAEEVRHLEDVDEAGGRLCRHWAGAGFGPAFSGNVKSTLRMDNLFTSMNMLSMYAVDGRIRRNVGPQERINCPELTASHTMRIAVRGASVSAGRLISKSTVVDERVRIMWIPRRITTIGDMQLRLQGPHDGAVLRAPTCVRYIFLIEIAA